MTIPIPGICVKSYKVNSNEKFFINICHTKDIPSPKDITEAELHNLLEQQVTSDFKVPLSITKPREATDKSNNTVQVSDVAINTGFFKKKVQDGGLFFQFVITLIFESIENKYKIEIDTDRFVVLKNRPFIGQLVEHQIYSRDVESVKQYHDQGDCQETHQEQDSKIIMSPGQSVGKSVKPLIQEIPTPLTIKKQISEDNMKVPEHRLIEDYTHNKEAFYEAEFYLPGVVSLEEISLDVGEDRIFLEARKLGYQFEGFLTCNVIAGKTKAEFDSDRMILKINMPMVA
jgi:hypothetical protein